MGEVWRAEHLTLHAPLAIKLIDASVAASQGALKRFMREARAAAALQSPHVVHTSDFGVHEGVPFIAMELMRGESLAARLRRLGTLSPRRPHASWRTSRVGSRKRTKRASFIVT